MKLPFRAITNQVKEVEPETATRLLNLDEFEVVGMKDDKKERLRYIDIIPKISVGVCAQCNQACNHIHQKREREVIDLPLGGLKTVLRIRFYQFHCTECDVYFTQQFKDIAVEAAATERFLAHSAEMIRHSDIKSTSVFFEVPEKNLERWYYEYVERKRGETEAVKPIKALGIDELSLKKSIGNSAL